MNGYLKSYFKEISANILSGHSYKKWEEQYRSLKSAKIINKRLAHDLENACKNAYGYLTFSEYLHIDQFSTHGYHATHRKTQGFQSIESDKVNDIVTFCMENAIEHVIDFGCGSGELGISLIKAALERNYRLDWSGIEINADLDQAIRKQFLKEKLQDHLIDLTDLPQHPKVNKKSIILFSFTLDSIPPELCINTQDDLACPDAFIGLQIKDGIISEELIPSDILKQKHITYGKGIFITSDNLRVDLSDWKLHPYQRAYVPIKMTNILTKMVNIYNPSGIVIIDEFRIPPTTGDISSIGIPHDLLKYKRQSSTGPEPYKQSGENLYYYPLSMNSILTLLHTLGFGKPTIAIDPLLTAILSGEHITAKRKINLCGMLYAKKETDSHSDVITLAPPAQTVF